MAALLGGLRTSLYMSNRLRAYFEYFSRLPGSIAISNLRTAILDLYTFILSFLAKAILTFQKGTAARAVRAFWRHEFEDFEDQCNVIG